MPSLKRGILLGLLGSLLAACAGTPPPVPGTRLPAAGASLTPSDIQCVPFARAQSGVKIFGDAHTWWKQAGGRYARRHRPRPGSVMVLYNYAGRKRAHVAVVHTVENSRLITVDHSNWLNQGDIFRNDPVRDVSPDNSWSLVNVYNPKTGQWGGGAYPVRGFIGPDAGPDETPKTPSPDDPIAQWIENQQKPADYAATDMPQTADSPDGTGQE